MTISKALQIQKRVSLDEIYKFIVEEAKKRDSLTELSEQRADPLLVARRYKNEYIALICALFAYGNAKSILKFLNSLDFSLLKKSDEEIEEALCKHYYRFQNSQDVIEIFKTLKLFKEKSPIESVFKKGYDKNSSVMEGIKEGISFMYDINPYRSRGYEFLIGKIPTCKTNSPYKRWHMYLRWMVRSDHLDLGLWRGVHTKDLLMPLDTHTFKVGKQLGLIQRNTYDFKAVLEVTEALKCLDANDPVKFDFALYRIGQEKLL